MSKLIFQWPEGEEQTVEIGPGHALTLGRAETNTVCINDGTLSRHHARLVRHEDGTCLVEDLCSTNGTTLNGTPVTRPETLQDGDRLRFGTIAAVYLAAGHLAAEADTVMLSASGPAVGDTFAGCYRLERALGDTADGHSFLASDLASEPHRLSLKIFVPGAIVQAGGFEPCARTFARVQAAPPHPGLVRLLDFKRWRGISYLTTEWIEGCTLLDVLRRRRALAVAEAMGLARQAATATDHCRVHRLPTPDLSPRAVLFSFADPLPDAARENLLDLPLERWPAFTLKLSPRLFELGAAGSVAALSPMGVLVHELLGHPASARNAPRSSRIAGLGEEGNAVLSSALAPGGRALDEDTVFIGKLAKAAGVVNSGG